MDFSDLTKNSLQLAQSDAEPVAAGLPSQALGLEDLDTSYRALTHPSSWSFFGRQLSVAGLSMPITCIGITDDNALCLVILNGKELGPDVVGRLHNLQVPDPSPERPARCSLAVIMPESPDLRFEGFPVESMRLVR